MVQFHSILEASSNKPFKILTNAYLSFTGSMYHLFQQSLPPPAAPAVSEEIKASDKLVLQHQGRKTERPVNIDEEVTLILELIQEPQQTPLASQRKEQYKILKGEDEEGEREQSYTFVEPRRSIMKLL